jgi:hypothetical protein
MGKQKEKLFFNFSFFVWCALFILYANQELKS